MNQFQPVFFRLSCEEEKTQYQLLFDAHPEIELVDSFELQLDELIKIANPSFVFSEAELREERIKIYGSNYRELGVWVYYPWLKSVVHLLDEQDFIKVRTNRNLYKIKPSEQDDLSTKSIGLIGLSVGHSVALTLAQERCFGEIRIADFDLLDLSNLNRIRTCVKNIGVPKTTIVAREIAEIDPFLKVTVFPEGITDINIEEFLTLGSKLDLLIDECDSLDIKIKCREKAKEMGIPVIMETSDRGMLDIERFDLEPNRPIFHNLIPDLDSEKLKGLSNEEKIPFIFPMIEMENSSLRLRASMFEIEQSISTWPQLASDVNLGGSSACNVSRRVLLNQLESSGRFFIDLNKLITDPIVKEEIEKTQGNKKNLDSDILKSIENIHIKNHSYSSHLTSSELELLIEAANSAPSGGNNQPWKWVYHQNTIYLILEKSASSSLLDHDQSGAMIAFGAASKNLKLRANVLGFELFQEFFMFQENDFMIHSSFSFNKRTELSNSKNQRLVQQISKRHTSRVNDKQWDLPFSFINELKAIQENEIFANLHVVDNPSTINAIGNIIRVCDKVRIMNKRAHAELIDEIRWDENENSAKKDGIDIETLCLSPSEHAGLKISKNWDVIHFLKEMEKGNGFLKLSEKSIRSSSALALITIPSERNFQFFNAGKFLQEIWLLATEHKIGLQPLTASLFMMKRAREKSDNEFNSSERKILLNEFEKLKSAYKLKENAFPAFLFRFSLTDKKIKKSLRKPITHSLIRT